jgi:subtilisin family serine protease
MLCGLLVTASSISGSNPAAAFARGFAGGFGRPVVAGRQWRRPPPPAGGSVLGRPSGPIARRGGLGYGGLPRHHRVVGFGSGSVGGGGSDVRGSGANNGRGGVPLRGDQRFVPNEVITAFVPGAPPQAIAQMARRYQLTQLDSRSFSLIGARLDRWRIGGHRSVANLVRALRGERIIASVQPNYVFTLQDQATQTTKSPAPPGDAAQYVLEKLLVGEAQQIATGKNVLVAVIDSEIDIRHPDLDGTIVKSFDAVGGDAKPHAHGTSIAGAIAAHRKLLGIALGVEILAVRAFDDAPGAAKGTSFAIYKGLQWAVDNGARVINMSFAGPADPLLQQMLAAAYGRGLVLIAAAGNGGPQSEPLYPAADPHVIAVTATDGNDRLFKMANRGRYIAVAAPGVDILALAPDDTYQITTGTSIAAAHVSGIAALLLERKPSLTAGDIRSVLITTAKPLGSTRPDSDFGAGLVNAYRAVTWLDRKPAVPDDGGAEAKQ